MILKIVEFIYVFFYTVVVLSLIGEGVLNMYKILRVIARYDHKLVIELDNLNKIIYDMNPRLHSVRFCKLADLAKFKSVKIENGNTLIWDSLCQITIDEIISTMER
ncbi:MAG: hypothetical protein CVV02_16185 [Firmicutes bacterium HGW-Firmicutes-7]|nr:MAG: hypothetical protein CVV02_16185 [Firmicutes bacterium HGW-Firmicutes-7]